MIEREEEDGGALDFPEPIAELASLYPARATAEWDSLVSSIVRSAAPELARRRSERGFVRSILRWSRPVGLAAAAVLVAGAIGLAVTNDAEAMVSASAPSFAEVVDREPATALLASDLPPSAGDLERAFESDFLQQVHP
jgi:hypothetical protein